MTENELQILIDGLDSAIDMLTEKRNKLNTDLMTLRSPFAVGDLIKWRTSRGRVIAIGEWCGGEPRWRVRRVKKDGTEGAEVNIYSFHDPELCTS